MIDIPADEDFIEMNQMLVSALSLILFCHIYRCYSMSTLRREVLIN